MVAMNQFYYNIELTIDYENISLIHNYWYKYLFDTLKYYCYKYFVKTQLLV